MAKKVIKKAKKDEVVIKRSSPVQKKIGQVIGEYGMIEDGDKVLVGLSGGKDSYTLLRLLRDRQKWAPIRYDLHAVHIQTNYDSNPDVCAFLKAYCKELGVPATFRTLTVVPKEGKSHCFWCSWSRRKKLFKLADTLGCNKIALGHHKDDIIETTLLNMFFSGNFSTMNPVQELFEGRLRIIRPLAFCEEKDIAAIAKKIGFKKLSPHCVHGENSKRAYMKKLVKSIEKKSPYVKNNILRSMNRVRADYIDIRGE